MTKDRPFVIGLTGSIGMGKTTTAKLFQDEGVPTWDADACVHRLYSKGGAGTRAIEALASAAIVDGALDRNRLKSEIGKTPGLLTQVEAVIHPLVREDREQFLKASTARIVLCDIPLLFETGGMAEFDAVVVVTAPEDVQRSRVLEREGMTVEQLEAVLSRQMPDAEKRRHADYVIDTSNGIEVARQAVQSVLKEIRGELNA